MYSTFNIAILRYMSYFIVYILSASEWFIFRLMALYKMYLVLQCLIFLLNILLGGSVAPNVRYN